jgi:hypothetical protein
MRLWRQLWQLPRLVLLIIAAFVLFAVLSLDWRPRPPPDLPKLALELHGDGELRAGAARVSIDPPFPTPIGGFNTRGSAPFEGVLQSLGARALVLQVGARRIALVSVELCVLPAPLRAQVLASVADLHLDDLFIAATHTHSGVGGYWNNYAAELIGLGRYDAHIEEFLSAQIAAALRQAAARLQPARISTGRIEASAFATNRDDPHSPVDSLMTGARLTGTDGHLIANLVVFAVHPTIIPRDEMRLSGDWPGAMMTSLEAQGGPPSLFFQGAVGDTTWGKRRGEMSQQDRAVQFGDAVASDARGALAAGGEGESTVSLDWARAEVGLPPCDLSGAVYAPFERISSNVFCWIAKPTTTHVSFLRVGRLQLASVPGEVVTSLGLAWRSHLGGATIVSLVDDYVGYVESPAFIDGKVGEAQRSYFGEELAPTLLQGLLLARDAALRPQSHAANR